MCGIVGLLTHDLGPVPPDLLERMTGMLRHRGPDDSGTFREDWVGLGSRRLAILDLTIAGHQPMESADGHAVIVFNGQIFNYLELRAELEAQGRRFRSRSDTEVLLQSYLHWGTDCLQRFNGEWAFLIWDRRTRTLFGARDRFGVKPMYRLRSGGLTGWASEIKALLSFPGYAPAINWRAAGDYLRDGLMDHTAMTFFESIESFPAGTGFTVGPDGEERRWRFWEFPSEPGQPVAQPEEVFRELFEDAVRLRLRSDVPVAVSLSGGLDSTSIICSAHRSRQAAGSQDPLRAFLYHHPAFDEQSYVAATVEQTGARLHRLEMGHQELWELAEQVLRAHDEPVHTLTAMVGYRLMHLIAESGVKVILSGQGADEVLGGYDSFFLDSWYTGLRAGRVGDVWRDIVAYTAVHGGSRARLGLRTARRVIQGEFQLMRSYRRLSQLRHLQHLKRRSWFQGGLLPQEAETRDPLTLELNQVLQEGVRVTPLPLYLRVEDRNSMASSVEVRLPFLDYRLVEFAFRLGPEWKVRGPWNKVLLRSAMRGSIPEIVRARPDKMGFPTPTGSLLVGESFERLFALVSSRRAQERGVYVKDRMIHDLEQHRDSANPRLAGRFFRVAQFELWAQLHGL